MTLQTLGEWLTKEERIAIKHAIYTSGVATTFDLVKIFDAGLGNTNQGRLILHDRTFSMTLIGTMRRAVNKVRNANEKTLKHPLWKSR